MSALDGLPPVPPATCQLGHPLVWLVGPTMEHAGGEGLAGCACARRKLDGREYKGSQPILWRWLPGLNGSGLRPQFVSQNRQAFALALRMLNLLDETGKITSDVAMVTRRAEQVAALAKRARRLAGQHARAEEARNRALAGPEAT